MAIPFLMLGAAAVAGAGGVANGASALSRSSEAEYIVRTAQERCQQAQEVLEEQRTEVMKKQKTLATIKLDIESKEIHDFMQCFRSFDNIREECGPGLSERLRLQIKNPNSIRDLELASVKASELTRAGIAALSSGALAGIASYGGVMMLASASTGTAIASLSGATAANATLAWFGGGSLAAGGLGMAGGTVVLGGIVAGPVLAMAGTLMKAKSNEKLANARQIEAQAAQTVEELGIMTDFLKEAAVLCVQYTDFLVQFRRVFYRTLSEMQNIERRARQQQRRIGGGLWGRKIDSSLLSDAEQETLHQAWLMAQVLHSVINTPLLTQKGTIDPKARAALHDAQKACPSVAQNSWDLL